MVASIRHPITRPSSGGITHSMGIARRLAPPSTFGVPTLQTGYPSTHSFTHPPRPTPLQRKETRHMATTPRILWPIFVVERQLGLSRPPSGTYPRVSRRIRPAPASPARCCALLPELRVAWCVGGLTSPDALTLATAAPTTRPSILSSCSPWGRNGVHAPGTLLPSARRSLPGFWGQN